MFIHIISCCSGGGSKQESPETDPSKTSGGISKEESSDTDPSQTPGKNPVKNRLGHKIILLIVFIDSQTHYFFYYLLFSINTSLKEKKNSVQE